MTRQAILLLEDGEVYEGYGFGHEATAAGEVVFDTAMAGYQEMLTDPSFAGQIVVPTYPLIGNYGINEDFVESAKVQVRGFVVREYCPLPSNWQSQQTLDQYLKNNKVPGVYGIDTRALTRHMRSRGTMMGIMSNQVTDLPELKAKLKASQNYGAVDYVKEVSVKKAFEWPAPAEDKSKALKHVVVVDMGLKYNIARILCQLGCRVTILPVQAGLDAIMAQKPDGVMLSPGPGDPALLDYATRLVKEIIYKKPVLGICLGHQMIAQACGAKTYKMKFGHRGGNHPVRDLATGRIHITTQNHGYAVDADTVKGGLKVSHINSNDNTVEGLTHRDLPLISVQYHSEGAPGPEDNTYLFKRFLELMSGGQN
jgi:carbamoyl-phosphate synthase small subunit